MRVSELIRDVENGTLILRPIFQRRLVWTNVVKDHFLETVKLGLPFPEIFIATGEIDTLTMMRKNWLVDGQQRISTLRQYVQGSEDLVLKLVRPYAEMEEDEKKRFLDYEVAVRDLGTVTEEQIKEIFSRINSTDYALKAMERMNALFNGAYIRFCQELSTNQFFERHGVFSTLDWRRMRDLDFCVIIVTTLLSTYYHRDEMNREYLSRYNDEFPEADRLKSSALWKTAHSVTNRVRGRRRICSRFSSKSTPRLLCKVFPYSRSSSENGWRHFIRELTNSSRQHADRLKQTIKNLVRKSSVI
jgi:hypothetical protein